MKSRNGPGASQAALRVVHLDTGREWRGGQRQALLLMQGLRNAGHENLGAFRAGAPLAAAAAREGFEVFSFDPRGEWDLVAVLALRGFVRLAAPHLLHAHDGHAAALALLAAPGLAPVVGSRRVAFEPRRNPLSRLKLRSVDRWVAVSAAARDSLLRAGVEAARVEVVPSGVALADARARPGPGLRERLGIGSETFLVVCAGWLEPAKGQRTLIEACGFTRDLSQVRWVVVGEGPDLPFLEDLTQELGIASRVVLPGRIDDLPLHLGEADLCVQPSFGEGLGTFVLDALAAGVPVVAADAAGAREVLRDGVEGCLVPAGDARQMARAVRALYLDGARRQRMGESARRRALDFTAEATARRTLAVYRRTLGWSYEEQHPQARMPRRQEPASTRDV